MALGADGDGDGDGGGGGGAEGEGEWRPWLQGGVILFDDRYVDLSIYLRVRVQLIGHARNNMSVNISRACFHMSD